MEENLDEMPPSWVELQAQGLRQTAYLCGEFWRSLVDAGCPAHLADNLVQSWFDDKDALELEASASDDD